MDVELEDGCSVNFDYDFLTNIYDDDLHALFTKLSKETGFESFNYEITMDDCVVIVEQTTDDCNIMLGGYIIDCITDKITTIYENENLH